MLDGPGRGWAFPMRGSRLGGKGQSRPSGWTPLLYPLLRLELCPLVSLLGPHFWGGLTLLQTFAVLATPGFPEEPCLGGLRGSLL